jgi:hypothetical protein
MRTRIKTEALRIFTQLLELLAGRGGETEHVSPLLATPCCVVVDCSWPIACKFTGNTQHVVMDDESCFVQLTDRIPTDRLVLDYSEVFYQNGWGWRDPPSYVLRRMRSRLKRFNRRHKQAADHHM